MFENTWLAFPALTAFLIQIWLFISSDKRTLIKSSPPLCLLFISLLGICSIELLTYSQLVSPSLTLMKLYYVSCFFGLAGMTCQAFRLTPLGQNQKTIVSKVIFTICVLLSISLFASPEFITGFQYISYSYTREPGPYYWIVQLYILSMIIAAFALLFFSTKKNPRNSLNAKRAKVLLVAITPLFVFGLALIPLMQLGVQINASVLFPIFTAYFLLVLIHTEKRESLFSILMRMPFSDERKSLINITKEIQSYLINTELRKLAENNKSIPLKSLTASIENKIVEWAVQMSDGSQVQAANLLGVSTSSVCRKKKKT